MRARPLWLRCWRHYRGYRRLKIPPFYAAKYAWRLARLTPAAEMDACVQVIAEHRWDDA